jgi:hypothetical protein
LHLHTTAPSAQTATAHAARQKAFHVKGDLSGSKILTIQTYISFNIEGSKLAYQKRVIRKLIMAGLGLAFLGFIVGSIKEHTFAAGIIFIGIVILGIIGIMKMRRK